MQLKFKQQQYQLDAVQAVVDCLNGQIKTDGKRYAIDPGRSANGDTTLTNLVEEGFANSEINLSPEQLLHNIQQVQRRNGLTSSDKLADTLACRLNLDVEMETGTGKTYCYIRTLFELHRNYGWSKYIIIVPSIAIREGVLKSFEDMSDHFMEKYGRRVRHFVYDSGDLEKLESFSSDPGINVMIINVQAFNTQTEKARRIYLELDEFQTRRPIDVISKNRPILILDEPQKMEGAATSKNLREFNPLMMLRYSATHKTEHNKVYRLDAIDAYNQKLVKKIKVRGITVRGMNGIAPYIYLEAVLTSPTAAPSAKVEFEKKLSSGTIKRISTSLGKNDNLHDLSGGLDQYRGFTVSDIDANNGSITFLNGTTIELGQALCDKPESILRRIQIREAIKAHIETESSLFDKGIKVLSLFFIDEVAKYKNYDEKGDEQPGEYASVFEEEYDSILKERAQLQGSPYQRFLDGISASQTHQGYFSIDRKTKRLINPSTRTRGEASGEADDPDAYDLILRDKTTLLQFPGADDSFEEIQKKKVRFIFSHSALREGWDNPNVFVICTLKRSDNNVSRRQEIGRGLRLCRDQDGNRVDSLEVVHEINQLTVIANESYNDFVSALQRDMSASLSSRPRVADINYFNGKEIAAPDGTRTAITQTMAVSIYQYLVRNRYVDENDQVTDKYHDARAAGRLEPLPASVESHGDQIFALINGVFSDAQLPKPSNDLAAQTNKLNSNFAKKEFQELWNQINQRAIYTVKFNSNELIENCIGNLNSKLKVTPLQYVVTWGNQEAKTSYDDITGGRAFADGQSSTESHMLSAGSAVRYDLIGKLSESTQLTRRTIATILSRVKSETFLQFRTNPEDFILKCSTLINEEKATMVIERLTYNPIDDRYGVDIFTAAKREDLSRGFPAKRHIYDYVLTDSTIEREFAKELEGSSEVVVYAKLPRGFLIPTPVGNYNPDWAIVFTANAVKHIYFVAETKGTLSSMELRKIEETKINCARKFFLSITSDNVKYDVVNSYAKLMEIVK